MSKAKVPIDAFSFYVALGPQRSYQIVAEKYGVDKRTIVRHAGMESWSARLEAIELKTRELTDAKLVSDLTAMQERHRKMLAAIASRAAKAIQDLPLDRAMDGIKAAEIVIKLERLMMGEPSARSEISVADTTRQELDRFLAPRGEPLDPEDGDGDW